MSILKKASTEDLISANRRYSLLKPYLEGQSVTNGIPKQRTLRRWLPLAKPRFSSVCERLFGTTNTQFLYNLAGNTQITKKVRLMTKSVNPKNLSVWTLGLLYMYLTQWAYTIYDTTEHPALHGQSPHELFLLLGQQE